MQLKITFCIALIGVFFFSCSQSSYTPYEEAINNILTESELSETKNILVLPGAGCETCISEATHYVLSNYDKLRETQIILTVITDYKLMRNNLGDEFLKSKIVKIDSNNYFLREAIKSNYPYLIELADSKVSSIVDFNEGMNRLSEFGATSLQN